jgi:hypothetical protein
LIIDSEVCGAEIVVLRVADGLKAPGESDVLVAVGTMVGSRVVPGGGVTLNVLDRGL